MSFKEFGQKLKEARMKQGIILDQIASKTKINLKFLEYIEEGNLGAIKFEEPFIRAFLTEYCQTIGLDAKEILSEYERLKYGTNVEKNKKEKGINQITDERAFEIVEDYNEINSENLGNIDETTLSIAKKRAIIILILLLILAFFIGIFYRTLMKEKSETIIKETKNEEALPTVDIEQAKEMLKRKEEKKVQPKRDSLLLTIFAKDSCWVKIEVDSVKERTIEFLLYPNTKKTLKAERRFDLNVGNSRVLELTLNGKKLEFEGAQKKIRTFSVDAEGVKIK